MKCGSKDRQKNNEKREEGGVKFTGIAQRLQRIAHVVPNYAHRYLHNHTQVFLSQNLPHIHDSSITVELLAMTPSDQ